MDTLLSMNMNSNGAPSGSRRDLANLLSLLDTAEEVATSGSSTFMGRNTDYSILNSFSLEPTPIRPDYEIAIRKQHFLMKQNKQQMPLPAPKTPDELCVSTRSSFSDMFSCMDDQPLNLDEASMAPMVAGSLPDDFLYTPPNKGVTQSFSFGENTLFPNTSNASIRFRKYQTSQWEDRFKELLLFLKEHGHLLVPHSYPPNQKLAQWVKRQRHQYKRKQMGQHSTLTDVRQERLLDVGFIFDSHRAVWHSRFETLKAFTLANGHCSIPAKFDDGSLNVWIKHQRRQYLLFKKGEKSTMTEERIAALNSIGFDWNPRNLARTKMV
ncbi:helicase domain protein [Nitzschia inconspicua]|uniref:Helicase domain protein n=1 Tax=Nitzschia inconspicua TaxID=303405 RepID=A0A9K3K6P4_9STRA|nr:helicase domain protein [Nitzschia inconspicua]KAG7344478.1 helicase domain protein [Nitzschia inconspicua]